MTETPAIRVMIADDHTIVRDGLARILNDVATIQVIGEAIDGREAVEKTRTHDQAPSRSRGGLRTHGHSFSRHSKARLILLRGSASRHGAMIAKPGAGKWGSGPRVVYRRGRFLPSR